MFRIENWFAGAILWVAVSGSTGSEELLRWGVQFQGSYEDAATGRPVSFGIRMPPRPADPSARLPLVVLLKRGLQVAPSPRFPFIEVKPSVAGIWGYRAMSAVDVMSVIDHMKRHYPIDEDRVYLVGYSAGASGAMHLASLYPDTFAAVLPLVAMGNDYPLRNFSRLPVSVHHGARDWTSSICNARVQVQKLQQIKGHAVELHEYPRAGHTVPLPHEPIIEWMLRQKRDPTPDHLSIDCETPRLGKNRYLQIREFQDPHERASIHATLGTDHVAIDSENVASFSLDLDRLEGIKRVVINSQVLVVGEGIQQDVTYRMRDGNWERGRDVSPPALHHYEAGAVANLYQGDPLLIVYGTMGKEGRTNALRTAAERLALCGGPVYSRMSHTRFPVVADLALTPLQESKCNLLLVGTAEDNSIVRRIIRALPIQIETGFLRAGDREALTLKDRVLGLLHPHPDYPARLIYLLAPFSDAEQLSPEFVEAPQRFLSGSTGFHRIEQADLLVQNFERVITREMQFDKNWEWISHEGEAQTMPARFADRNEMALVYLEQMKEASRADVALWWGPADKGMWGADFNYLKRYCPPYSRADFRVKKRVVETMIGEVTGAELLEIERRWIAKKELTVRSGLSWESLDPEKRYRVHIPMDLYIKLGQRRKNLGNPVPGPDIAPEQIASRIF